MCYNRACLTSSMVLRSNKHSVPIRRIQAVKCLSKKPQSFSCSATFNRRKIDWETMLLEICVDSLQSARNAIDGGADRLELCAALSTGGLTPTVAFFNAVQRLNVRKIPIFCMIRCRESDFCYSSDEMRLMLEEVQNLKNAGSDGFVFGALTENGKIDMEKCQNIINQATPLPVTFHRAFDVCENPFKSLEILITLGFTRILTSGCAKTARLGCDTIAKLIEKAQNRIIILVGGGLNCENIPELLQTLPAKEWHASAKKPTANILSKNACLSISGNDQVPLMITDTETVVKIVQILHDFN